MTRVSRRNRWLDRSGIRRWNFMLRPGHFGLVVLVVVGERLRLLCINSEEERRISQCFVNYKVK
jgi:hypothetical protein